MGIYRKKPVVVRALTFEELVGHGLRYAKAHGGTIQNGMPWSFTYEGRPITHENDDCYLVPIGPAERSTGFVRFSRADMLVTEPTGELFVCSRSAFDEAYVEET